jgi:hypothetical protein
MQGNLFATGLEIASLSYSLHFQACPRPTFWSTPRLLIPGENFKFNHEVTKLLNESLLSEQKDQVSACRVILP